MKLIDLLDQNVLIALKTMPRDVTPYVSDGSILAAIRKEKGLLQSDIAEQMNAARSMVSSIENSENIKPKYLLPYLAALKVKNSEWETLRSCLYWLGLKEVSEICQFSAEQAIQAVPKTATKKECLDELSGQLTDKEMEQLITYAKMLIFYRKCDQYA